MADLIHPTAVISNDARLGSNVRVLPFSVISGAVEIGDDSVVGPHAVIHDYVRMGRNNRVHAHSVIGDLPQDVSFDNEETWVEIGDDNLIRGDLTGAPEIIWIRRPLLAQRVELAAAICNQRVFFRFFHAPPVRSPLYALFQAGFDEPVQITVEHRLSVPGFDSCAQVFYAGLIQDR